MSYNNIGPLPKKSHVSSEKNKKSGGLWPNKSDAPSEQVKKALRDLDDIKKPLVTNFDTVDREGPIDTVDKKVYKNLMRWTKPSILQFYQKMIFTQLKKQRNHKHKKRVPSSPKKRYT